MIYNYKSVLQKCILYGKIYISILISFKLQKLTFADPFLLLFLFDNGRRGLLGLGSFDVGGENGGDVGRNLGDCFPEDDLGDANVECDNGVVKASPCVSCLRLSFKLNCVSGSLNHLRNSSSTFSFRTGFSAIVG